MRLSEELSKEKIKRISGIYCIKNIHNNKVYIGQTKDFYERFIFHSWQLKIGKHDNPYLQNEFNVFKKDHEVVFEFQILEIIENPNTDLLNEKELFWFKQFEAGNKEKCYNLCTNPYTKSPETHSREFELVSPEGILYTGKNVAEFARQHKLDKANLYSLLNKKKLSCKGWTIPNNRESLIDLNIKNITFVSPDKKEYPGEQIQGKLTEFCESHKLNIRNIYYLIKGKQSHCKGWIIKEQNKEIKIPLTKQKNVYLKSKKTNKIFGPINDIIHFLKEQNIDSNNNVSSFYKVINGKRKSACGFILFKIEEK